MMAVPPGAAKLPKADDVNLKTLMATGGLMKMGKLPSQTAIEKNANSQVRNPTFKLGLNIDAYDGGPTMTAAMVTRMQEQQVLPTAPVLAPNQVPTQLQIEEFHAAGVPVPQSNAKALEQSGEVIVNGKVKPVPPPIPVATPKPVATPRPQSGRQRLGVGRLDRRGRRLPDHLLHHHERGSVKDWRSAGIC